MQILRLNTIIALSIYLALVILGSLSGFESHLFVNGLLAIITAFMVMSDLRKIKSSKASKIVSVILISLLTVLTLILGLALGGVGKALDNMGDKAPFLIFYLVITIGIIFSVTLIVGIVRVFRHTKDCVEGTQPIKTIVFMLCLVMVPLFYTSLLSALAEQTTSSSLCNLHIEALSSDKLIFWKGARDKCIFSVIYKRHSNVTDRCRDILGASINNSYKIRCFSAVALKESSSLMCEKIAEQYSRDECYRKIAVNTENISLCAKAGSSSSVVDCYIDIAVVSRDPVICEKLAQYKNESYDWYLGRCFNKLAEMTENLEFCKPVQGQVPHGYCDIQSSSRRKTIVIV